MGDEAMALAAARHLIVTGGTGYIGSRLVDVALRQGRRVTLIGRSSAPAGCRQISWTLGAALPADAIAPDLPPASQALVHLAHSWHDGADVNVTGTETLFAGAKAGGLGTCVFISSQSAREGALNRYGQMKWTIEQRLPEAASLRVGLVYGGPRTAMYGLLCRLTQLPLLPMIDPHRCVQPIHRDEVVDGILGAADQRLTGVYGLAGPLPMPFGDVLRALALAYQGRHLPILPVPIELALFGCDVTARLPLIPTVDRERVLGLAGTEAIDSAQDLRRLGVYMLPLVERLASEPQGRRALIREARALLRHAAGHEPSLGQVKRYVRAFPQGALACPRRLLRWREPLGAKSAFARRLRAASRIAESGRQTEMHLADGSQVRRLARLMAMLVLEGLALPARLLATVIGR